MKSIHIKKGKKRNKYIFLIILICLVIVMKNVDAGTHYITSCSGLQAMNNDLSGTYYLDDNLVCGSFTPIGSDYTSCFSGDFYGNAHTVSNLQINTAAYGGLFGFICGGRIQDLGLINTQVTTNAFSSHAGTLAGYVSSLATKETIIQRVFTKGGSVNSYASDMDTRAGGLIGSIGGLNMYDIYNIYVLNSYAQVDVHAHPSWNHKAVSGGLIGNVITSNALIYYSYSTGKPLDGDVNGGLIGSNGYAGTITVTSSYWDTQTSGISTSNGGTGKTTSQMHQQSTFVGWDFTSIWCINDGIDYPRLRWEGLCGPPPCNPQCFGKSCGDDDTCGGKCDLPCNDNNPCTNDICNPSSGCSYTAKCTAQQYCEPLTGNCIDKETHTCPSQEDIIMKLIGSKNSLATLWDEPDSDSNYQICYSEIFGNTYIGTNPHSCSGTNKVIGLKIPIKSLTQVPNLADYPQIGNVCYGNLVCRAVREGEGTVAFYKFEGNANDLSGNGNNGNVYGATLTYGRVGQAYSFNGASYYIDSADSTSLKSQIITVSAWVKLNSYPGANNYEFILEKNLGDTWASYGLWINSSGYLIFSVENKPSAYPTWSTTIPLSLNTWYHVAGVFNKVNGNYLDGNIYINGALAPNIYKANGYGSTFSIGYDTGNLNIGREGGTKKSNYFNGIIDEVKIWNRALSASEILNEADVNNPNSNCASDESIVVRLFQENNSHISNASDLNYPIKICCKPVTNIISGGKYVFANISKPEFDSHITGTQVQFNATTSFAINVTVSPTLIIDCLGGLCPAGIMYSSNYVTISDPDNKRGNFSALIFAWKFDDLDNTCDGVVNRKNCTTFKKIFSSPGNHFANLNVSLASGENDSTYTRFTTGNICLDGGNTWWDGDGMPHNTTSESYDFCKGPDGIVPSTDDCCPAGYTCTSGSTPGCKQNLVPPSNITACSDYKDSVNCSNDTQRVGVAGGGGVGTERCGKTEKLDNVDCGGITVIGTASSCKCEWKNGACKLKLNMTSSIFEDVPFINTCYTSSSAEECIDESMKVKEASTIEWDNSTVNGLIGRNISGFHIGNDSDAITWLNDNCNLNDLCPNEERFVICGEDLAKLEFFSWINLIFAFIIIIIIYLAWYYKKRFRKKHADKKGKRKEA